MVLTVHYFSLSISSDVLMLRMTSGSDIGSKEVRGHDERMIKLSPCMADNISDH